MERKEKQQREYKDIGLLNNETAVDSLESNLFLSYILANKDNHGISYLFSVRFQADTSFISNIALARRELAIERGASGPKVVKDTADAMAREGLGITAEIIVDALLKNCTDYRVKLSPLFSGTATEFEVQDIIVEDDTGEQFELDVKAVAEKHKNAAINARDYIKAQADAYLFVKLTSLSSADIFIVKGASIKDWYLMNQKKEGLCPFFLEKLPILKD